VSARGRDSHHGAVLEGLAKAHAPASSIATVTDNIFLSEERQQIRLSRRSSTSGSRRSSAPRDKTLAARAHGPRTCSSAVLQCAQTSPAAADGRPAGRPLQRLRYSLRVLYVLPPHTGETSMRSTSRSHDRAPNGARESSERSRRRSRRSFIERALCVIERSAFASAERRLAALTRIAPAEKARVPLDGVRRKHPDVARRLRPSSRPSARGERQPPGPSAPGPAPGQRTRLVASCRCPARSRSGLSWAPIRSTHPGPPRTSLRAPPRKKKNPQLARRRPSAPPSNP